VEKKEYSQINSFLSLTKVSSLKKMFCFVFIYLFIYLFMIFLVEGFCCDSYGHSWCDQFSFGWNQKFLGGWGAQEHNAWWVFSPFLSLFALKKYFSFLTRTIGGGVVSQNSKHVKR
jgi:hypothetical protein